MASTFAGLKREGALFHSLADVSEYVDFLPRQFAFKPFHFAAGVRIEVISIRSLTGQVPIRSLTGE
jgi:hypothetical protein